MPPQIDSLSTVVSEPLLLPLPMSEDNARSVLMAAWLRGCSGINVMRRTPIGGWMRGRVFNIDRIHTARTSRGLDLSSMAYILNAQTWTHYTFAP